MSETDYSARGKITAIKDGKVIFIPTGTTYELYLAGSYNGPMNELVDISVKAKARKVYTVPSGGNFITPIFGPPKIVQGRVLVANDKQLIIHAAIPFHIDLPRDENAIDLDEGGIAVGKMVNAVLLTGTTFELAAKLAGK